MKKIFSNDYLRLFIRRESRVVLGNRFVNLWILAVMLLLTFLAIAFSNASLSFLQQKMDDPFTNWVNLPVESDNDLFRLQQYFGDTTSTLNKQYHIEHFSVDYSYHYIFFGKTPDKLPYLGCLFFQSFIDNPLLDAILSPSNIVNDCAVPIEQLNDELIGVIITKEKMEMMGYNDSTSYPAYINFHQASEGADQYGVNLYDGYAMVPIPVLAVVRSLPMNMDIVASLYFFQQQQSVNRPFNLNNPDYASTLIYSVEDPEVAEKINDFLYDIVDDDVDVSVDAVYMPYNLSFRSSTVVSVEGAYEDLSYEVINDLDQQVREEFANEAFTRVYEYDFSLTTPSSGSFVSVQFSSEGLRTIGNGLNAYGNSTVGTYNYVDCLYVRLLQRFGIVFMVMMAVLVGWSMYRLYQRKEYHILLISATVAAHCVLDDLSFALHYNTFWMAMGVVLMNAKMLNWNGKTNQIEPKTE